MTDPAGTARRFGRVRVGTYTNDFNTGLGAATLRGSAMWTNQAVRLTDAVSGQTGTVVFDGIATGPFISGFTARFEASFGPFAAAEPADGISFSVGDLGTGAWGEGGPGTGHSLAVGFDTFENGVGIPAARGIHLHVNGTHVAYNPINPYTNGAAVPVEVSCDAATGVTVRFNGAVVFKNVSVPGFSFQAGDRFAIGGRNGVENERHVIDDVEITTR